MIIIMTIMIIAMIIMTIIKIIVMMRRMISFEEWKVHNSEHSGRPSE